METLRTQTDAGTGRPLRTVEQRNGRRTLPNRVARKRTYPLTEQPETHLIEVVGAVTTAPRTRRASPATEEGAAHVSHSREVRRHARPPIPHKSSPPCSRRRGSDYVVRRGHLHDQGIPRVR